MFKPITRDILEQLLEVASWQYRQNQNPHTTNPKPPKQHAIAGISGGRTSAKMAFDLPESTILAFMNTGKEHQKTLEFLRRLEDDLGREITRLEFRAPPRGDPPGAATFEIVPHDRLSRKGEPFMDLLLCLASYRAKHKGLGPVAPWARQRLCTAHLKIKTKDRFCASMGWKRGEYIDYVGLRADEPDRVANMKQRNEDRDGDERAPLFDAGVTKADVLKFWASKPYDLEIPEHLGNCTGCFLKDESDLAEALLDPETDAWWWIDIEKTFAPMRRNRSSYEQVLAEAPMRRRIRTALECGIESPTRESSMPQRRHELIVRQERKRMVEGTAGFSCSCEAAHNVSDDDVLGAA
jgi:3'-phosphoadenosine 5'-phosphosulfate sulfotransferase (PAPS reductase)/FAD synthetase